MRRELQQYLASLIGVSTWDSIQFSMLPDEDPIGYMQLARSTATVNSVTQQVTYLCWVGISSSSLDNLLDTAENMVNTLVDTLSRPNVCIPGVARIYLGGDVVVDTPDTYVNQNVVSGASGFKMAIAFQVVMDRVRP